MADNKNSKLPEQIVNPPSWLSLPSAWDWSLSYAENLRKLVYNVNVIIQYLQDLQTNYEDYTDQKVAELKTYVDAADQALHDYADSLNAAMKSYVDSQDLLYWEKHTQDVTKLQNNIDALRSYCDENFEDIRTKHAQDIAQLHGALQSQYEQLTAYTDRQIGVLQAWTNEQLDQIRLEVDEINEDGFRIDNPTTGERDRVGNTVNDVYNALRVHAITCEEFDAWFTYYDNDCDSFRNLFISAIDFDTRARLLMYAQYDEQVNSPATGIMVSHAQALEEIMSFSSEQALNCTDRDGLDLTCDTIEAKNKNAFWWDTETVGYYNNSLKVLARQTDGTYKMTCISVISNGVAKPDPLDGSEKTATFTVTMSELPQFEGIPKPEWSSDSITVGDTQTCNVSGKTMKATTNDVELDYTLTYSNGTTANALYMQQCIFYYETYYNSFTDAKGGMIA